MMSWLESIQICLFKFSFGTTDNSSFLCAAFSFLHDLIFEMAFKMTAPHAASFSRILLAPFALLYLIDFPNKVWVLFAVVALAALSDFLDGYLARKLNSVSELGASIDFTADKIFINTFLCVFTIAGDLPIWMLLVILNRDFWVMGMRIFAAAEGMVIPAGKFGKWKTFLIFSGIVGILIKPAIGYYLMVLGVVLSLISMILYTASFMEVVRESKKKY